MADVLRSDADPFVQVPNWILFHDDLDGNAIRVWGAIASHLRPGKTTAWPSRDTLQELTHLSRNTVDRCLRDLRTHGALTWTTVTTAKGKGNVYTLRSVRPKRRAKTFLFSVEDRVL